MASAARALRGARSGEHTELHLGHAEPCVSRDYAPVASEYEFKPVPKANP